MTAIFAVIVVLAVTVVRAGLARSPGSTARYDELTGRAGDGALHLALAAEHARRARVGRARGSTGSARSSGS